MRNLGPTLRRGVFNASPSQTWLRQVPSGTWLRQVRLGFARFLAGVYPATGRARNDLTKTVIQRSLIPNVAELSSAEWYIKQLPYCFSFSSLSLVSLLFGSIYLRIYSSCSIALSFFFKSS